MKIRPAHQIATRQAKHGGRDVLGGRCAAIGFPSPYVPAVHTLPAAKGFLSREYCYMVMLRVIPKEE